MESITYDYSNIRSVYEGKNNSYYFLTNKNFFKIVTNFGFYKFYPLIKPQKYDFSESHFLLTVIYREDNLIINHKNKIIFYQKKEKKSKNTDFRLNNTPKILIYLLIYILFKI